MKQCPACGGVPDASWHCGCGWQVSIEGGFPAFAPELARENAGFQPGYFAELAALEEENFWFKARNALILEMLEACFPGAGSFLEIGCGTGYVLSGIRAAHPDMALAGSEIYAAGLGFAAGRAQGAALMQMDARNMPFSGEFDAIGAFDVLEHIIEDEAVLSQMFDSVKPGGGILVTVPQHPFMWSEQDVAACHVRRYTRRELSEKMRRAGFRVERATSFVSLLFPLMMASRLLAKQKPTDPMSELKLGRATNRIFEAVMGMELKLISSGLSLPFGGSLLMVGRKA